MIKHHQFPGVQSCLQENNWNLNTYKNYKIKNYGILIIKEKTWSKNV